MARPQNRIVLVAADPRTYRTRRLGFSRAWETAPPELLANMVAQAATTIGREWTRRYGSFPLSRITWRIESELPEPSDRSPAELAGVA